MKRTTVLILSGILILSPAVAFAEETDVAALEERVAALEATVEQQSQIISALYVIGQEKGIWGNIDEELAAIQASSEAAPEDLGASSFEADGCSLSFVGFDIMKEYSGSDALVLYFDFVNGSDQNKAAMLTFNVQVFQNGKEQGPAVVAQSVPEYNDSVAQVMPGADQVRVAFISKLEDASDVIVRVSPLISRGGDYIEIPLSLQ